MLAVLLMAVIGSSASSRDDAAIARLEALISSTNALDHFHAEYAVTRDGRQSSMVLDFRAPGQVRIRGSSELGDLDSGYSDHVLWISARRAGKGSQWAEVDFLDRGGALQPVLGRLREEFWRDVGKPEVGIGFSWGEDEARGSLAIFTEVKHRILDGHGHFMLLGWLHRMLHDQGGLTLEGDELVLRGRDVEMYVDSQTGFLRSMRLGEEDEPDATLHLVRLDLENPPASDVFTAPEAPADADDVSDDQREAMLSPQNLRVFAQLHVHSLLEREGRRLDGKPRDELRSLLAALIEPITVESFAELLERVRSSSQEFADWVRSSLDSGRPAAEVDEAIAERRKYLQDQSLRSRAKYSEQFQGPQDGSDDSWEAIRQLELEVVAECFEVALARPVIEHFDRVIEEARGG